MHVDDFLCGRIISLLKYERTRVKVSNEKIDQVSTLGFGSDSKVMDISVDIAVQVTPPPITMLNEDRYLAVTVKSRWSTTFNLSHQQLSAATDMTVLRQTMYKHLGHIGVYACKLVLYVPLMATPCSQRLA
ncbi:transposable element Tcb1 transposase [Trichonephila clavipes]|nr:transposable element Tcb1 transposase [Trichonephila clavipes]